MLLSLAWYYAQMAAAFLIFNTRCSGLAAPDACSHSPVYDFASLEAKHSLGGWTLNAVVLQAREINLARLSGIAYRVGLLQGSPE